MKSSVVAPKHRRIQARDKRQYGGVSRTRIPFVSAVIAKGEAR